MAVTPAMIKELRETTNAGMMDCKKALTETNGDMEAAIEWLRKKGIAKAGKVAGKTAAEGTVAFKCEGPKATIMEVNCETDFVGSNENFVKFATTMVNYAFDNDCADVEALKGATIDGKPFEDLLGETVSKVGEKVDLRRFQTINGGENVVTNGYVHANGKIGVIVAAKCDSAATCEKVSDFLRDVAMHAAAMSPGYMVESEIPAETLEKEAAIAKEQLAKEGKPEAMWDKILPGKIKRFVKDNCLVDQPFVKDDKKSVAEALAAEAKAAGGTAEICGYVRYGVGEGIEKKEAMSFADEVAAQIGNK